MKWTDVINLAGSIASVTGVSLVWLHTLLPDAKTHNLILGTLGSVVGTLLTVGLVAFAIEALLSGSRMWGFDQAQARNKTIYWSFSIALAIVVVGSLVSAVWTGVYIAWVIQ